MENLEFLDNPEPQAGVYDVSLRELMIIYHYTVISSLKTLWLLGAMDHTKNLTQVGKRMGVLPLDPTYARAVLASKRFGCTREILDIISVLSASSKLFIDDSDERDAAFHAQDKFRHLSGDHVTILNALRSYETGAQSESKNWRKDWCRSHFLNEGTLLEAAKIRDQLRIKCESLGLDWRTSCGEDFEPVLKSLCHGLVQNSALLQPDGSYKQTMGHSVRVSI